MRTTFLLGVVLVLIPQWIPQRLSETGLYADLATKTIAPGHVPYTPRFPLWSDGATKQRWVHVPAGTRINQDDPQRWEFPNGTTFFKEFRLGGRIETRMIRRDADGWSFASYLWADDESDATLVAARGARNVRAVGSGVGWDIPGRYECLSCHADPASPILGFNAEQLAGRQPSDSEDAQLRGYLKTNCGTCHNRTGPLADLDLFLEEARDQDLHHPRLVERMASREPSTQMPPLGTHIVDSLTVDRLSTWLLANPMSETQNPTLPKEAIQ